MTLGRVLIYFICVNDI